MLPVKKEITRHLNEIADMMEFIGENVFKIRAFRNASNSIRGFEGDIMLMISEQRLNEIKGIGKGIQPIILDFVSSGSSKLHAELEAVLPKGISELFEIKGLGPKKAALLFKELNVTDRNSLIQAVEDNRLAEIQGFGEKTSMKILEELKKIFENEKFCLINKGFFLINEFEKKLASLKGVHRFARTGEARRIREIFSALEFVLIADSAAEVKTLAAGFISKPVLKESIVEGVFADMPVKLYITGSEKEFQTRLFQTTGENEFHQVIGYKGEESDSEVAIFNLLELPYIAPENRETEFFNSPYFKNYKPSDLKEEDFKGHFHFHTYYSDGFNSLEEMYKSAAEHGYQFSIVCDHSQSAFYAGGLTLAKIEKQRAEIEELRKSGVMIFQGIESDILADGSLDYPEDVLKKFSLVVASVHSRLNLTSGEMTARMIKAIENPYTDILAHPTGRILLKRDPYPVDIKKVIDACAANEVALEINSNPKRLDTDWRFLFYAREKGVRFAINADAHATDQIAFVKFGTMIAKKSGITAEEVINCYDFNQFKTFASRKVKRDL